MLIAIDGGATHCRLAVFTANGERAVECRLASPASLSAGVPDAVASVRKGIRLLESELGESLDKVSLCCGLAGSLRESLRQAFVDELKSERRILIITDGHAQLLGVTSGRSGTCLAVGTGSVIHWQDADGVPGMAGGWGYPIGDEASAAWLGLRLLRGYVRALDRREPLSPLWVDVQQHVGSSIEAIQSWTTCSNSSQVGSLAKLISRHAKRNDDFCLSVINEGVDECEQLMDCAPAQLPRWIQGGLCSVYQPLLESRGHVFERSEGDALDGLYLHADARGGI